MWNDRDCRAKNHFICEKPQFETREVPDYSEETEEEGTKSEENGRKHLTKSGISGS